MLRGLIRFVLLAVSTFFAPATGPTYWQFHAQMDRRAWEIGQELSDDECNAAIKSVPGHFAFTQFFIQSGGNNAYAGSTNSTTPVWGNASVTWTGSTTGTIAVTDSSASAVSLNDWINVNGAFISQVTNISNVGSAYTITLSTSAGTYYGTEPGNGTYAAYDGGAWADLTGSVLTSSTTVPLSTLVNVAYATYTLSGPLTVGLKGTTTHPLQISGYTNTPGDLTAVTVAANSYPIISGGANSFTITGPYTRFTGFSFTANRAGSVITNAGETAPLFFDNCRFANADSASAATTINISVGVTTFTDCYFTTPAAAAQIAIVGAPVEFHGCWFAGAGSGSTQNGISGSGSLVCIDCVFVATGLDGIAYATAATLVVKNCTFSKCGRHGINLSVAPSIGSFHTVTNCLFRLNGGYGVLNTSGTNTANVWLKKNSYYLNTSGQTNGFSEGSEILAITEPSDPCVSDSNLTLVNSALSAGAGFPGQFQNVSTDVAYPDVGASQRQVPPNPRSLIIQPTSTY